jgi:hypothetical protein
MGKFVTDAVKVVIVVAAVLAVAAILNVGQEAYEESGTPHASTAAVE